MFKKKAPLGLFTTGLILTIVTAYSNCSGPKVGLNRVLRGTELGNPMVAAPRILDSICGVIERCQPQVTSSQCQTGVRETGGMDTQLGLSSGTYSVFADIIQAEQSGSIGSDTLATESCLLAINNLSCSDPAVQGAYDPSAANPFAGAAGMIVTTPGTCPAVYAPKLDFYVATTGSDVSGDGSANNPWATIGFASQNLSLGVGGARVHVASGVYSNAAFCPSFGVNCGIETSRSGTASARISYISDERWGAKITPVNAYTVWANSGNYVDIVGFEIMGDSASSIGVHSNASSVRLIGNHIHNIPIIQTCTGSGGGGIIHGSWTGTDNESIGNLVHDIGQIQPDGLPSGSYCVGGSGIHHSALGGKIQNNIIYRISHLGILLWQAASNQQVSHNLIFDVGAMSSGSAEIGGGIMIGAGDANPGATNDYTTVSNNIVRGSRSAGILESGAVGSHNMVANNLLYQNRVNFRLVATTDVGSLTSDPQMVNFRLDGTGDYSLAPLSPAIDAGTTNCAIGVGCTPLADFAGVIRPNGPGLDIGPYEWHP